MHFSVNAAYGHRIPKQRNQVKLCIMRYPGWVLGVDEDPPAAVVAYVAE